MILIFLCFCYEKILNYILNIYLKINKTIYFLFLKITIKTHC